MKLIYWLRSFVGMILFISMTITWATLGIFLNLIFNRRRFDNWIMRSWGKATCFFFNIHVKVYGLENFIKGRGAILLFNHASFIDILAMAAELNSIRFGAKIELFKIPIFGYCMRRFGTLPIARNNREEVMKVYEEAKVRFARGEKFALSPEGGRFHGDELSSFKAGPFLFAMTAGVPLIPVVIKGAYETWPKGKILANSDKAGSVIEIHVLEPVETKNYSVETRGQLQDKIYTQMNAIYKAKTSP